MDLGSKSLKRLTNNAAIDTEPAWAPDGKTLYFTSNRGGSPRSTASTPPAGRPAG